MIVIPMWAIWVWLVSVIIRIAVIIKNTVYISKFIDKVSDKITNSIINRIDIKVEEVKKKKPSNKTKKVKDAEVC